MLFCSLVLAFLLHSADGFIGEKSASPLLHLDKLVEAQCDQRLSLGLNIGKPDDVSRLAVNGLVFDLSKEAPTFNNDFVKMPGLHGLKSSLSGGLNSLNTVQDGSFISMTGIETVKPLKGCWEIIWKEGAENGSILCGFETEKDYKRNDATLPQGTVYVSFNAWSSKGLKQAQDTKKRTTKLANDALHKKHEELAKMAETNNMLQKARHYYNALSAAEAYSKQPKARMELIPNTDEVVHFEGDMYVSTNGHVWTQDLPTGKPSVLGTANMKLMSKEV